MRQVYILGDGGHDYSDAKRFGELHFIHLPAESKWDLSAVYDILREELRSSDELDLLLVSNLASHLAVATAIMVEWYGRVNFLLYRNDKYEEKCLITDRD